LYFDIFITKQEIINPCKDKINRYLVKVIFEISSPDANFVISDLKFQITEIWQIIFRANNFESPEYHVMPD